ncbi:MAG: 3'-5' exonuclease [Acidimicrobiales bacterium]
MARPLLRQSPLTPVAAQYARTPVPTGKTPWHDARYCVVDLELSGLDPRTDEIISFAAVPIDDGRLIVGEALYGLSRPTQPLPERSVLVHGIRTVDLADAPPLGEAIQPLLAAMTGRVMVAHVATVERSFLAPQLRRQGVRLHQPILDTYELARLLAFQRHQPFSRPTLDEVANDLQLPVHRPHHALGDALTTAQVFLALASHLEEFRPETVRSLARAHNRVSPYTS